MSSAEAQISAYAAPRARAPSLGRLAAHDWVLLLVTCAWPVLDDVAPFIGGTNFALYLVAAGIFLLGERRFSAPKSAWVFTAVTIVYAALSLAMMLPQAWTTLWDPDVIPHQALFVLLPFVIAPYRQFFRKVYDCPPVFVILLVAAYLGSIVVPMDPNMPVQKAQWQIYGTGNGLMLLYIAVAQLCIAHRDLRSRGGRVLLVLAVIAWLAVISKAEQNYLLIVALAGFAWLPMPRASLVAALALGIAAYAVAATWFVPIVWAIHNDSGFRLALVDDAFTGVLQSHWIGVGFGREIVRNQSIINLAHTIFLKDEGRQILTGTHNSFIDVLFRMGIPGFAAFTWLVFGTGFPRRAPRPTSARASAITRAACFVFAAVFTAIFFNVALSSPYYLFGVCAAFGYLLAVRDISVLAPRAAGFASKEWPMQHEYAQPGSMIGDESPVSEIAQKLWNRRIFVLVVSVVVAFLACWYAIQQPRSYTVTMTLAPASRLDEEGTSGDVRGQSLLGNLSLGGLLGSHSPTEFQKYMVLLTSDVISTKLADEGWLQKVFKNEWDAKEKKWHPPEGVAFRIKEDLRELLGLDPWTPPTATDLSAFVAAALHKEQLAGTPFEKVDWRSTEPQLSKDMLLELYKTTEAYIVADQSTEKELYMRYLESQIGQTTLSEQRAAITRLIGQTEYQLMLLHSGRPYTAVVLDGPTVYRNRLIVTLILYGIGGLILGFLASGLCVLAMGGRDLGGFGWRGTR